MRNSKTRTMFLFTFLIAGTIAVRSAALAQGQTDQTCLDAYNAVSSLQQILSDGGGDEPVQFSSLEEACGNVSGGRLGDAIHVSDYGDIGWGSKGALLGTDQGANIELKGDGAPYIDFSNNPSDDFDIRFQLTNDDAISIIGGNVGIGTASPSAKLDVSDGGIQVHNNGVSMLGMDAGRSFEMKGNNEVAYIDLANQIATDFDWRFLNRAGATPNLEIDSSAGVVMTLQNGGNVGIGTGNPIGKLDVNGSIVQRGTQLHADYVFEPDYELESIEDNAAFMWREKHLPAIPPIQYDDEGLEILDVGAHRRGIVEELEKAHVYIQQLHVRLEELSARVEALERR